MRTAPQRIALGALGLALGLLTATAASAQYREFTGRIVQVDANQMTVNSRKGDQLAFVPAGEVRVTGSGKARWSDLAESDRVNVSWKMVDSPPKAYKVKVLPKRQE